MAERNRAELPNTMATRITRETAAIDERARVKNMNGCRLENMAFP
jgi:hypothetical protein